MNSKAKVLADEVGGSTKQSGKRFLFPAKAAKIAATNLAAQKLFHESEVDSLKKEIASLKSRLNNQVRPYI